MLESEASIGKIPKGEVAVINCELLVTQHLVRPLNMIMDSSIQENNLLFKVIEAIE